MNHDFESSQDREVVIVGRPNVGKSSLFNCILRRRAAIVDSQPGVTRDRLKGQVCRHGRYWTLVDTGGLENPGNEHDVSTVTGAIRRQVNAALVNARLALLIVDAKSGLTGLDAAIAEDLRRRSIPTLVVVNKCDHDAAESHAAEFCRLGMICLPVSAAHSRGIEDLLDEIDGRLAGQEYPHPSGVIESEQNDAAPKRIAIVGRPNVGKSSLINAFLKEDRLLVSDTPGTTRDSVDIALSLRLDGRTTSFVLTDTAGLRRKRQLDSAVELFSIHRAAKAVRDSDMTALVLEAGTGPTAQDKKIAALIREHRRATLILVNKADLLDKTAAAAYRREIETCLPFMKLSDVCFVSALKRLNLKTALQNIASLISRIDVRLPTGPLNRAIEKAVQRVQPPIVRGKRAKLFYVTQTGNNPLRIVLFVNQPTSIPQAYRLFLEREIRRSFKGQIEGLPIVFDFKKRIR